MASNTWGAVAAFSFLFVTILPGSGAAAAVGTEDPRWDRYEIHQFISTRDSAPATILKLDNNGEIVWSSLGGMTREQLRASGLDFAESQIKLLKTWGLLAEQEDVLRCAFPVFASELTEELRRRSGEAALALAAKMSSEVGRFLAILGSTDRSGNAYTVLFSYVLDDLVWDRLIEKGLLEERAFAVEAPFWAGEIWATYPPRDFSMGTNSISDRGVALKVSWTEKAIPKMRPFVADWTNFGRMFEDYLTHGRVLNEEARSIFAPFNLFDDSGRFTVPVIVTSPTNPLYKISDKISRRVARELPALLDLPALTEQFGFRDERQCLVAVYHDVMWDLMDHWEKQGLVRKPDIFADPDQAEPADVGDLVFIVRDAE